MKKIGIVGGIGWKSTADYYAGICQRSEELAQKSNYSGVAPIPEIAIESLDMNKAVAYLGRDGNERSWERFDQYHRSALRLLEASGADLALIASNTAHHRFAQITRDIELPVINIFETTAEKCVQMGAKAALIFGTEATMGSEVLRNKFAVRGIAALGPSDPIMRSAITELISELQTGRINDNARRLADYARFSIARQFSGDAPVCLACTELPLAFPDLGFTSSFEYEGVQFVNTMAIHIDAAVASAFGPAPGSRLAPAVTHAMTMPQARD